MLPDTIYRALPYIYIVVGVACAVFIASPLVYVASAVLVVAGLIVFWMRHAWGAKYRPILRKTHSPAGSASAGQKHEEHDRRRTSARREFPIINHNGEIIAFDRRLGLSR